MWKEECKNAPLGKGCLFCCLFWGTMHGPLSRDRALAKERWFRDTQLQCCPLIEAQIPLSLLGRNHSQAQSSLCTPPGSPRVGALPSLKRKLPKCSQHQQPATCSQESASSSSHPLLWVWTHTLCSSCLGLHGGIVLLPGLPHGCGRIAAGNCLWGWMIPFWPDCLSLLAMVSFPN